MMRRLHRERDDAGFGLVIVMGMMSVLMIVAVGAFTVAHSSLTNSRAHSQFEIALDVAESGVDQALANLQNSKTWTFCGCTAPTFASEAAERTWARSQLKTLAASTGTTLGKDGQGQWLAIRPSNRQVVYSMSWVPSYAAVQAKQQGAKSRLIKAEYIFAPYAPSKALLTRSDLTISGSVVVDSLDANYPGAIHSDGNVSTSNASLTTGGTLTSSGTYSVNSNASVAAGSGGGMPFIDVPTIDPRQMYTSLYTAYSGPITENGYTGTWYDLCDDGFIHARDTVATATTPCTGTKLNSTPANVAYYPFRGWTFNAAANGNAPYWSMDEGVNPYEGAYYGYGVDLEINGASHGNLANPWHATVMAESKTSGNSCNKTGGSISWKLTDISNFIPGAVIIAGHNFYDSANNSAGKGMFAAADQVYMQTSSADLTGYVVAGDACPASSSGSSWMTGPSHVQGVTVHYDQTGEVPISSIVRTTLWLEYTN